MMRLVMKGSVEAEVKVDSARVGVNVRGNA